VLGFRNGSKGEVPGKTLVIRGAGGEKMKKMVHIIVKEV
jgi:hypothetical protein